MAFVLAALTAAAPVATAPLVRRIIAWSIQGSSVVITIAAGSNDGVQKDWKVCLLRGNSDEPLPGGEVEVIRVDKSVTVGKVHLAAEGPHAGRVLLRP